MQNQTQNLNQNSDQNNQKTFLSSLTAKIILALIVFAGSAIIIISGTKFIIENYKIPINKIIKSQCEIDSDCQMVYVGFGPCPPCDYLLKEYQCLNESEKIKIWNERIERDKFKPVTACSPCAIEPDRYICECKNGKCEKVKIIEKTNCAKEGEIPGKQGCCSGLVAKGSARVGKNGECLYMHHLECLKCGDGLCDKKYENKCNCPEDCGDEKIHIPPVIPTQGVTPPPKDNWPVYEQKFYCEKDNDCLATCTSPGCYNKNWYETVMRGDCEAVIIHSCRCIENECIRHPLLKEDIESEIRKSNYCDIKDDCVRADSSCSLGCNVVVNKNKIERINKLIGIIKGKCLVDCGGVERDLDCMNNKCIIFR